MNPLKNFQEDSARTNPPENFSRFDRIAMLSPNLPRNLCGRTGHEDRHTGGFARLYALSDYHWLPTRFCAA